MYMLRGPSSRLHTGVGVFLVLLMVIVVVMTMTGQTPFVLWIPLLLGQGNNLDFDENNQHYRRSFVDMPLDGSEFWDVIAVRQGLTNQDRESDGNVLLISSNSSISSSSSTHCHDFFAVWPGDCVDSFSYLNERLRALSAQMVVFNATLTIFTTDLTGCTAFSRYPKIRVEKFNATEELHRHGFSDAMPLINQWDKTKFTRISDILRLCLAYRHRMSYLDTDVHFLQLQRHLYEKPYVGAQLYSDNKNAIEITNAAFCLPRAILSDMMGYQRQRILQRGNKYKFFYTELGPSMFHHVRLTVVYYCTVPYSLSSYRETTNNIFVLCIYRY